MSKSGRVATYSWFRWNEYVEAVVREHKKNLGCLCQDKNCLDCPVLKKIIKTFWYLLVMNN